MKKILLGFLILATICIAKNIEIHSGNYDNYTFETKDATYTIKKSGYESYSLFKSIKSTGELNRILVDRSLHIILGHLVSRDAEAVKLYPTKANREESNVIKAREN